MANREGAAKEAVTTVLTGWLVDYLMQTQRFEWEDLTAALGLPQNMPARALECLSLPRYLILLNLAADRLGDINFGLNLATQTPNNAFGPVGLMMRHTATLRESFESLDRFGLLLSNAMGFSFVEGPIQSRLEYRILLPTDEDCRHDNEFTLALFVLSVRNHFGQDWLPTRVNFSHPRPKNTETHHMLFGKDIFFEQAINSLHFETSVLDAEISDANPRLLSSLREQVEHNLANLKRQDNLVSQVRYYVSTTLSTNMCTVDSAARHLLTSKRSLTRHLKQLGTSFRSIKQDVMQEMAKSALGEAGVSVTEIALHLGFSETSAFDRSFKNLTGYMPQQYRRLHIDS
jgi:AraC-like DNA-binding protein